jgi:protein-S-isoprenylcysteine O-methyltransferase Ste14
MTPLGSAFFRVFASSILFVGLMVLGWGSFDFFRNIPNFLIAVSALAAPFLLSPLAMHAASRGKEMGESRIQFLILMLLSTIGLAYFLPYFYGREIWILPFTEKVRYLGVMIYLAGYVIRIYAARTLKRQFSFYVTIQENHQLVTTGIYSLIRHPVYLGTILAVLGMFMVFPSWFGLFFFVLYSSILIRRISREERLLLKYFGSVYEDYSLKSFRLIPHLY